MVSVCEIWIEKGKQRARRLIAMLGLCDECIDTTNGSQGVASQELHPLECTLSDAQPRARVTNAR